VNGREWLASLTPVEDVTWAQTLATVRELFGGKATRWLADALDVDIRTTQRYYTGEIEGPARHEVKARLSGVNEIASRRITADLLRLVDSLDPGVITVYNQSDPNPYTNGEGTRSPGELDGMNAGMQTVADLWEAGQDHAAEAALSDAVIARYFDEQSDDRHGAATQLGITDYSDITYD
jgi:hypothetical protein